MTCRLVCAVIVTYHPGPEVVENITSELTQVQGLVVVDNGSHPDELNLLRQASSARKFHLIENRENLGVAEALNQGVRWARQQGYPWLLFFDQDSKITPGFVNEMFGAWETHPHSGRVASIHPRYVDPETGTELHIPRAGDDSPIFPMTSGALMPRWIFDKIGGFASEYFVDLVDWEYSFRIRTAGFLIADSKRAQLLHAPGDPAQFTILGRSFPRSQHNAVRRYYMSRNCIAFYRKYLFAFPDWIFRAFARQMHETLLCLIADENRARQFRSFILGTWDGLIGRMGKRDGLVPGGGEFKQ